MGLGSTARTLQRVADMAEDVYSRLNDVREQLKEMRSTVQTTNDRVAELETELAEQRTIVEAIAENAGIDVESAIADAHIAEAETDSGAGGETAEGSTDASADADASEHV